MKEKNPPQNINELICEIGERMVLFHLYNLVRKKDWVIFKNLIGKGYDISLRNIKTNKEIKIEVKTRQMLVSNQKPSNSIYFSPSKNEIKNIDFLVGYWLEKNEFYIVPKIKLKKLKSYDNGKTFRYTGYCKSDINKKVDKSIDERDKWELILH